MAKANQATKAKRNRKKLLSFLKRTFSGFKKLATKAAKLPAKANKAIKRATDSIAKAAHSQSKCSPAAARKRVAERKPTYPPRARVEASYQLFGHGRAAKHLTDAQLEQAFDEIKNKAAKRKPCPVAEQRAAAIDANTKRIEAETRKIAKEPAPNGNKLLIDSIRSGAADVVMDRRDRARAAVASVHTTITVPAHHRKGTKGVTQHRRATTMKEKNQMAAERVMRVFKADDTEKRTKKTNGKDVSIGDIFQPEPGTININHTPEDTWKKVEDLYVKTTRSPKERMQKAKDLLSHQDRAIDAFKAAPSRRQRDAVGKDIQERIPKVNDAMGQLDQ